jgi:hypothetical protein
VFVFLKIASVGLVLFMFGIAGGELFGFTILL